ncbi:MAG: T9SS type A sorting domain-containing protein [Bacteroidales bacterium]|nr:T9SS type A sorting domain-containing protein [Bacteroidales bacterium]
MKNKSTLFVLLSFAFLHVAQAQWHSMNGPQGRYVRSILCTDNLYYAATGGGVMVSSDQGLNWEFRNNGLTSCDAKCLAACNDTVFLATDENIFRTTDGGLHWMPDPNLHNHYIKHILVHNGSLFAATYVQGLYQSTVGTQGPYVAGRFPSDVRYPYFMSNNENAVFVATYKRGVYRSFDNGTSWETCSNGVNSNVLGIYCHNGKVFATVLGQGVMVSSDNGNTWTSSGLNKQAKGYAHLGDTLYAACFGDGVFASFDNGVTWHNFNSNIPSRSLWCMAAHDGHLLVGDTQGRIYRGNSDGTGWTRTNTPQFLASVGNIGISGGRVLAATHGSDFFYTDNGNAWTQGSGIGTVEIRGMMVEDDNVFIGTDMLGSFLSTDRGYSFNAAGSGLPEAQWLQSLVRCGSQVIAGSKDRMYVSFGIGRQWYVPTCLPHEIDVVDLTWDGSNMYHVSYDGVLRYSSEQGSNWQVLNSPFQGVCYTALRHHAGRLYLGTRGHGLYFTDDMGATWCPIGSLPTDATIRRIATADTIVAVGCEDGIIYLKYDHSDRWQRLDNIPVDGPILDICIDGERLYASPMAGGIWYTDLPPILNNAAEADKMTFTIAPNPASAFITVSTGEFLNNTSITVYDLQGKVCYHSLMQGDRHEICTSGFPTGIYFVKVVGHNTSIVRKVAIRHQL